MSIKITPIYDNLTTTGNTTVTTRSDASFEESMAAVSRTEAALAVDSMLASDKTDCVPVTVLQEMLGTSAYDIPTAPSGPSSTPTDSGTTVDPNRFTIPNEGALKCSDELHGYFEEAAKEYGVDVKLLKAIAFCESSFDPSATSCCGAMGVMQLMPSVAESLGIKDGYDARSNIMGGASVIASHLKRFDGNLEYAIAAYNTGPGNVKKYGGVPSYCETYVNKVMKYYKG